MAEKEFYDVFSENFLTCHICLEEFKNPRVLPCYHSFCLECIADHAAKNGVQNKFSCPVCRQEAPVPPGGLETLAKNFFLRKVIDFMKDQKAPEGKLCEYCNHKEATFMCKVCPETNQLCATCRDVHDKIPYCKGHLIVPLSQVDLSANPVSIRDQLRHVLDKAQYCDKHGSELLTFYCEEDDIVACAKLPRFEKAEKAIVRMEERFTENHRKVLRMVDSQKLAMTEDIKENSETIERELRAYYQQVEKDELQTVEPDLDDKIIDITFTPGKTKMDVVLQFPKIPEPQLSIKAGSITAKTYQGPLDAYFGSLKQDRAYYPELMEFQKICWLGTPERGISFNVKGWPVDIRCTDDGCILVANGDVFSCKTASVFSSTVDVNSNGDLVVGTFNGEISTYKYIDKK
ncbi:E3 ubiquitin-protein ligase TRIM56-like [Lingula anatina]|uniref:E3 ubiquitin-protein ligase TRIM56-like n=1 Tax=Lingula anatina TaxID=7574 RepID=A0A2R2MMU4_LINAN|nr:E3 ubiquitin-protein ligase TRIM56-like [Lingula anatina]|eukprot:XP_023931558.1 E3 ubiquitin-protein ligase TRIM56-like [Lingula anatina]